MPARRPLRDLTDDEARAGLTLKWGVADPDVVPAWVAEMDFALDTVVADAVVEAVRRSGTGYPTRGDGGVGAAFAGFAQRQWGWSAPPDGSVLAGDVVDGIQLALELLCENAPVVVPVPAYPPFLEIVPATGRQRIDIPLDPDAAEARLDLDAIGDAFRSGARTLLLCNPHNPWGRVFTRPELEAVRDLADRYGAKVISDEIHGSLVLPGAEFVPYLSLDGTAGHGLTVTSPSKAFNTAGLHCAHLVSLDEHSLAKLRAAPLTQNHGYSPLGVAGALAAYQHGDPWLASLVERLDQNRSLLHGLLAEHLPEARTRPLEATYLAWVDLRAYGHTDPAAIALEKGRVWVAPGHDYQPGLPGHVRINIATRPSRLEEVVRRLAGSL